MFSQAVRLVANTRIFARASKNGRQFLAYSMEFDANEELAMILPIPVPKGAGEKSVEFINLEKYENFFDEMLIGFPPPKSAAPSRGSLSLGKPNAPKLEVHQVGKFEASFVPSLKDFDRLDARFRLSSKIWDKLPMYRDSGFAVFQLKREKRRPESASDGVRVPASEPARAVLSDRACSRRLGSGQSPLRSHAVLPTRG